MLKNDSTHAKIPHIGLTGGIGCGKSAVANTFIQLGALVIDSDALAHQVTAPSGAAIPAILEVFGPDFILADGSLNRSKMREFAFNDKAALTKLENITHPLIQVASEVALTEATLKNPPYIIFMIPLLFESKTWQGRFEKIVVVDCSEEQQIERVMQRSHWSREQIEKVMAAQISRVERLKNADYVIRNDGVLAEIIPQVGQIHHQLIHPSV